MLVCRAEQYALRERLNGVDLDIAVSTTVRTVYDQRSAYQLFSCFGLQARLHHGVSSSQTEVGLVFEVVRRHVWSPPS